VKMFYGNFDVVVRALTYVLTLGKSGIREAAMNAVLNANYMRVRLKDTFTMAYDEICMHEFVMSLVDLHKETGVSALDLAKGMLDFGLHPPRSARVQRACSRCRRPRPWSPCSQSRRDRS